MTIEQIDGTPGRPIRVIHIVPQIGIGGAEVQLCEFASRADPKEVVSHVLYFNDSRDDEGYRMYARAGVSLERVPRNYRRPIRFLRNMAAAIREYRPEIVHCWLWGATTWGRLAAKIAGVRHIIVAFRSAEVPYPRITRLMDSWTRRNVVHMANSRACADTVAGVLGVAPERFYVIYNGVDTNRSHVNGDRTELCRQLGIPETDLIVLKVGRLTPAKNYPMLLRVAQRCKGNLPVQFVIAGHGELESELSDMAADLGVDDIVHFLGLRTDTPQLMRSADVFCYTSWYEGFPNALLEAMTAGLPIITTDFGAEDELIENGRSGRIVPRDDDAAAFGVLQEYVNDSTLRREMGASAQAVAIEKFSMDAMVSNTVSFYRRILNHRPRGNDDG